MHKFKTTSNEMNIFHGFNELDYFYFLNIQNFSKEYFNILKKKHSKMFRCCCEKYAEYLKFRDNIK